MSRFVLCSVIAASLLANPALAEPPKDAPPTGKSKPKSFDLGLGEEEEELPEGDPVIEEAEPIEAAPAKPPAVTPPTGEKGRVVVLLLPSNAASFGLVERIADRTAEALAKNKDLSFSRLALVLDPNAPTYAAEQAKLALEGVSRGETAIEDLDYELAATSLEEAVNGLLAQLPALGPDERDALARGIFAYAATTLYEGHGEQADALFVALALLDPKFEPDGGRFPSNVVARYREAKAGLEHRPTGALQVKTNPPGAAVTIDGSFRGYSPLEVGGLADGQHTVYAERLGVRSLGTLAPVAAERSSSLDLDLLAGPAADLFERLAPGMAEDEKRALPVGAELGATRFLILRFDDRMSGNQVSGLWLDVPAKKILGRIAPVVISSDPEVAATTLLTQVLAAEAAGLPPPVAVDAENQGVSWWVWAIVGGVAAAAAVGAVAIVASVDDGPGRPPSGTAVFGF